MAIYVLVRGYLLKKPPIAAHCTPLLLGNFSQGGNSSKVLPLQPIAAHYYMAISVRGGGNSSKVLPLQPSSYIILPPLNKLPPHSYINLPPYTNYPPTLKTKWEDFREDIRPGKPSAFRAQPGAQAPSALSSNCLRLPSTIL